MLFRVAIIPGLFAAALLTGCVSTPGPTYVPTADEPTARLNLKRSGQNEVRLCWADKLVTLRPDEDGYATIPANQHINISDFYHRGNATCNPAASFTAEPGKKYATYFKLDSSMCYINILLEDNKDPDRLQRVPTLTQGSCR